MTSRHFASDAEFHGAVHAAAEAALTGARMAHNSADAQNMRRQLASAISGGYDFADTLHNIYLDYGYPAQLSFGNFWNMYRRFGVATRAVEIYPDYTWGDDPVIEAPPALVNGLDELSKRLGVWRRLRGLDTRQRVGRYAGLFMRVRDGKEPTEPLDGTLPGGLNALVDMVPLYEGQLQVSEEQDDPKKDDFGMPKMYQFNGGAVGSKNEKSASSFQIHPSRVIIAAEGSDNSGIYGTPVLEAPYNSLMDLRKVLGGGAEGFYKNAAQNIVFDVKDAASAASNATLLDKFNQNYDEFSQNRSRRGIWTPGMEAKTLDSSLVQPKEFVDSIMLDIAAGVAVPVSLLVGNQTGRLAGDQDSEGFLALVQSRRLDFASEMVSDLLDWLIKYGVLPSAEYEIEWPDAMAPAQSTKLDNASKMTLANKTSFESGGGTIFTEEEIRAEAGYEDLAAGDDDGGEELPEGVDDGAED